MPEIPPLLTAVLPAFADELAGALDDTDLARQVADLRIWSRCSCGDDFCASFWTEPTRAGGDRTEDVPSDVDWGMVFVQVVDDEKIQYVEVLHRPDVRVALDQALGRE